MLDQMDQMDYVTRIIKVKLTISINLNYVLVKISISKVILNNENQPLIIDWFAYLSRLKKKIYRTKYMDAYIFLLKQFNINDP